MVRFRKKKYLYCNPLPDGDILDTLHHSTRRLIDSGGGGQKVKGQSRRRKNATF